MTAHPYRTPAPPAPRPRVPWWRRLAVSHLRAIWDATGGPAAISEWRWFRRVHGGHWEREHIDDGGATEWALCEACTDQPRSSFRWWFGRTECEDWP